MPCSLAIDPPSINSINLSGSRLTQNTRHPSKAAKIYHSFLSSKVSKIILSAINSFSSLETLL